MSIRRFVAVLLFLPVALGAQARSAAEVEAHHAAFIRDAMEAGGMPGIQTIVLSHDSVVWQHSYGSAVLSQPGPARAMKDDDLLCIASVGKLIASVMIMQEVEKGTLKLDADINGYLPFPVRHPKWPDVPITLRMLLTHTASINDPQEPLDSSIYYGTDQPISLTELSTKLFKQGGRWNRPDLWLPAKPGTDRIYSNFGMDLAGYVLTQVTHDSFEHLAQTRVLTPLGMSSTFFSPTTAPVARLTVGYGRERGKDGNWNYQPTRVSFAHLPAGKTVLSEAMTIPDYPSGDEYSTASDLSRLLLLFMHRGSFNGHQLLKPATVDSMLTPSGFYSIYSYRQGLVIYASRNLDEEQVWGHDGQERGYIAALFYNPVTKIGAVSLANANRSDYELSRRLVDLNMHLMDWFTSD